MSATAFAPVELQEDLIDFPTLFERQVEQTPDTVAIFFEEETITYRELSDYANSIARYLVEQGVKPQQCVGLSLDRSIDAIAAMIGVMQANAVFVPLDPELPDNRLSYIIEDAQIPLIICDEQYRDLFEESKADLLQLSELKSASASSEPASLSEERVVVDSDPSDLAYIMYTSGSTGNPKGVQIEHRGLATYCFADIDVYQLVPEDRTLQFSTLNFDIAIEEIFPPLLMGSSVVVRPRGRADAQNELSSIVEKYGVTAIHLATAYWHEWVDLMIATEARVPESIRLMVVTGEKVSTEHFRRWKTICDQDVLWCNAYGPTEATVSATVFIPDEDWDGDNMPIGKPLKRYDGFILNKDLQHVAEGETGELHVGGPALARGYLNREDLTENAFIKTEIDGETRRLYKTGDLARWLPNGDIDFAGRIDHQIKLGSYRIEPGEIEAAVNQCPQVLESLVSYDEVDRKKYLIAYVATGANSIEAVDLADHLRGCLPPYMVPTRYVFVESFPKTINGKVDRKALPSPESSVVARNKNYAPPQTPLQEDLVRIWQEVLNVPQVGIHDDFFALGGSSLLVTRVIAQISKHLKTELPVRDFFANPTIALIAKQIGRLNNDLADDDEDSEDPRRAFRETLPAIEGTFFASGDEQLFGGQYRPVGENKATRSAVVICPAFGHEYARSHRNLQQLAVQLAKAGHYVLRFDYSGTGNSSGDCEDVRAEAWQNDIEAAVAFARQQAGTDQVVVLGVRFGATLAALYAESLKAELLNTTRFAFWDPVQNGQEMLELFDEFHSQTLSDFSIFPVKRKRSNIDQAFGVPMNEAIRESFAKYEFDLPTKADCKVITSKDYRAAESLPLDELAPLEQTDDEIYWHTLEFNDRAFASPEAFNAIVQFAGKIEEAK